MLCNSVLLCSWILQFKLTQIFSRFSFLCLCFAAELIETAKMSLVQPSGEMSAKIREELREPDAETVAKDVAMIREWLEKQPHLPKDMGKRS